MLGMGVSNALNGLGNSQSVTISGASHVTNPGGQ